MVSVHRSHELGMRHIHTEHLVWKRHGLVVICVFHWQYLRVGVTISLAVCKLGTDEWTHTHTQALHHVLSRICRSFITLLVCTALLSGSSRQSAASVSVANKLRCQRQPPQACQSVVYSLALLKLESSEKWKSHIWINCERFHITSLHDTTLSSDAAFSVCVSALQLHVFCIVKLRFILILQVIYLLPTLLLAGTHLRTYSAIINTNLEILLHHPILTF